MAKTEKTVVAKNQDNKFKGKPRNIKNVISLSTQEVAVYASPRISKALEEVTKDLTLYHGVRLTQVLEAVYAQGLKDGARGAFAEIDDKLKEVKAAVPHRNPGKPKK